MDKESSYVHLDERRCNCCQFCFAIYFIVLNHSQAFLDSLVWWTCDTNGIWVQACPIFAISRFSNNISVSALNSSTLGDSGFAEGKHGVSLNIHKVFG